LLVMKVSWAGAMAVSKNALPGHPQNIRGPRRQSPGPVAGRP
jgi:hypothetical protein